MISASIQAAPRKQAAAVSAGVKPWKDWISHPDNDGPMIKPTPIPADEKVTRRPLFSLAAMMANSGGLV